MDVAPRDGGVARRRQRNERVRSEERHRGGDDEQDGAARSPLHVRREGAGDEERERRSGERDHHVMRRRHAEQTGEYDRRAFPLVEPERQKQEHRDEEVVQRKHFRVERAEEKGAPEPQRERRRQGADAAPRDLVRGERRRRHRARVEDRAGEVHAPSGQRGVSRAEREQVTDGGKEGIRRRMRHAPDDRRRHEFRRVAVEDERRGEAPGVEEEKESARRDREEEGGAIAPTEAGLFSHGQH